MSMTHSMLHYLWPFLDHDGLVVGISPFPDIACHTIMYVYAIWLLGYGTFPDFMDFKNWNCSLPYFKLFWVVCIFGSALNIVASLLIYEDSLHFDEAWHIFEYSSIFQAISTGIYWSVSVVNPLNCKSQIMINYHIIPWLVGAIVGWFVFLFDNQWLGMMVDHGFLQFIFMYPIIATLSVHLFEYFILKKEF